MSRWSAPLTCLALWAAACAPTDEPPLPMDRPDQGADRDARDGDLAADASPQDGDDPDPDPPDAPDAHTGGDDGDDDLTDAPNLSGGALYHQQCRSCHGEQGEGASGPPLRDWPWGRDALIDEIDRTMPLGQPERCQGPCAEAIADFMLRWFGEGAPINCEETPLGRRQLRLLTRREYQNTVRDLFGLGTGRACQDNADCDLTAQTCQQGQCVEDPCDVHAFVFDPGQRRLRSVHVAGSFNGWPARIDEGGWALEYLPAQNRWVTRRRLTADQRHTYKLVLDEAEWITDPTATQTEPDGFGGQNAALTLRCDDDPDALQVQRLTRDLPPETRPTHYSFDNHADAGRVTSVHVEEYLRAADALAAWAVRDPGALLPCAIASPGCARRFVEVFGRRAFRRPLRPDELDRYAALITAQPDLLDGVQVALRVFLTSPNFLYRFELGEPQPDGTSRLTPYERASALSYLFWATMPDDALLQAAANGDLDTTEGLAAQAERLLRDPRAQDVMGVFALQWLGVEHITSVNKQAALFPDFDQELRAAMLDETRRFVNHVVFQGSGRFDELLTADYTFAQGRLAQLYGVNPDDQGRASWQGRRAGFLGHGSVLGSYAHSDQTSPIKRGVFVRERLLCQQFGAPPANAGGVPDVDPNATTRERFAQHSSDPACRDCHQYIDDLGFGFERFDPIGQWRDTENGRPVDALGNMNDLEGLGANTDAPFDDLAQLGAILASGQRAQTCFATQVHRFATGRLEEPADACALERVQRAFLQSGGDIRALWVALVTTPEFTHRR